MILFDVACFDCEQVFEAWFGSNADFEAQSAGGLVQCPFCPSSRVSKAPMAPMVPRRNADEEAAARALNRIAGLQAAMLKDSRWVGDRFPEVARAMHFGETPVGTVHGEATADQAAELVEEGVPIVPLPLPVVPPTQVN